MTENTETTGKPSRMPPKKRRVLLGVGLAIIAFGVVVITAFRTDLLSSIFGRPGQSAATRIAGHDSATTATSGAGAALATSAADARGNSIAARAVSDAGTAAQQLQAQVAALLKLNVEFCGLSPQEAAYFMASSIGAAHAAGGATLAEVAGKLRQSDRPSEQLLGQFLQANLATMSARDAERINRAACSYDEVCSSKLAPTTERAIASGVESLAKIALAGQDPDTYAAALYACDGTRSGTCASINYAGWAAIEPDNAAVW
ncbi:MAG: hypothetical protein ABL931_22300, partial [Usitatibacteraceae bacterium]